MSSVGVDEERIEIIKCANCVEDKAERLLKIKELDVALTKMMFNRCRILRSRRM